MFIIIFVKFSSFYYSYFQKSLIRDFAMDGVHNKDSEPTGQRSRSAALLKSHLPTFRNSVGCHLIMGMQRSKSSVKML